MASKRKPEGLEIVLTQVLALVLTLISVVPLLAFLDFTAPFSEFAVALIVYAAWLLVISMVIAPAYQKRATDEARPKAGERG